MGLLQNWFGTLIENVFESNVGKGLDGNLDGENLDYAVLSEFISFPLYDVLVKYTQNLSERGSFPGRVLGAVNNEDLNELIMRLERIDYIMVSPSLMNKCISAKVYNGKENWFLSDHYPVLAEFDMPNSGLNNK